MTKIPRKTQKIFGGGLVASGNVAQMGSTVTGTPVYSTDPDVLQALPAYSTGFASQVVNMTNSPVMQEFNAAFLLFSQQLAYLFQNGVAEWDSGTTYYANTSYCSYGNILYRSLQDGNLNKTPDSNPSWWEEFPNGYAGVKANVASLVLEGLLAWSNTTTYSATSIIKYNGKIYRSIQAANLNHVPTDASWWTEYPDGYQAALANISTLQSSVNSITQNGIQAWNSTVSYAVDAFTRYNGQLYQSLQASNLNKNPASQTAWWRLYDTEATGAIKAYAGSTAPTGYLLCQGQVLNISAYPTLGALLGSTYGGNGTTTFGIPDLRGRAPVGAGTGDASGATNWQRGRKDGAETVTLTTTQIPAHTHSINPSPQGSRRDFGDAGSLVITTDSEGTGLYPVAQNTGSTGGGGSHNNLTPSLGLNFIIKT